MPRALLALGPLLALIVGCGGAGGSGGSASAAAGLGASGRVVVQLGGDLPAAVTSRIPALVRAVEARPVDVLAPTDPVPPLPPGSLVLSVGDARAARELIADADLASLPPEGFVLRSDAQGGVLRVAARGAPRTDRQDLVHAGNAFGAYAALEALGVAFLHPLAPTLPPALHAAPGIDERTAPRWRERGLHLHTMHPTELTHLLQGWGPGGPGDVAGWRAMLPEWEAFCEWLLANRQSSTEWVLLAADSWSAFADSAERQARLAELVDIGHAWGLRVGADAPLALAQQHAWRLLRRTGNRAQELAEIHQRVDWLAAVGFDFVSTELGFSEFTHPDDTAMLAWLDAFTERVAHHGMEAFAKAHVSQGQVAQSFVDPLTGGPLNFNFLTRLADPRLGVMPHTVQHYALDDPAPTYGATDFGFMRRFMQEECGARKVVWFPETAYWVSFDIDVPLFLPLYADRRVHDARLIAQDEDAGRTGRGPHAGTPIDGQMVFSSGWEWGYWLNDVVTARLAWDPQAAAPTHDEAVRRALAPVARAFGPQGQEVVDLLVRTMREQRELLIEGRVNGVAPADVVRRNGQAYLQGWESWDEVAAMLAEVPILPGIGPATTQPDKLGMLEMTAPVRLGPRPDYPTEVEPLLREMAARFDATAARYEALVPRVAPHVRPLLEELSDGARVTALRARQVHGLYDYCHGLGQGPAWRRSRLDAARAALDAAAGVVARREAAYRVPADRVAGWGDNPTCYDFGYLWTARTLFFWWRDEGKAVDRPSSPAYLNIIDPIDTAFGEGYWLPLTHAARALGQAHGLSAITDLLAPPAVEPAFPQNGLRSRP